MSERRSSTICAVIERTDHHCDDDLVVVVIVFIQGRSDYHRVCSYSRLNAGDLTVDESAGMNNDLCTA